MLPKEWGKLGLRRRSKVILFMVWLIVDGFPRIIKYSFAHAGITFGTMLFFPPAAQTPPIAIPIVWAASFAMTYSVMAVFRV